MLPIDGRLASKITDCSFRPICTSSSKRGEVSGDKTRKATSSNTLCCQWLQHVRRKRQRAATLISDS
jgi:hypothetical protein